jgi:type VI secretion system protein ImpA
MYEVEKLLAPISGTQEFGEDISFSRELDAIVEARRFEDSSLDQGEWITEIKTANWPLVMDYCATLIETRSKDLRLAVWLTEAGTKLHQFSGLSSGYFLIAGLCEHFWDGLYPLPDEGDQEQRIGNLHWILSRSIQLIKEIPITEGKGSAYSMLDFDSARARAANVERLIMEGSPAEEGPKLADLELARKKSSRAFYEKLFNDAQQCQFALMQLERAVDARLGVDGPGFSSAKETLDNAIKLITRFAQDSGLQTTPVTQQGAETTPTDTATGNNYAAGALDHPQQTQQNNMHGSPQTRAQALAQLREVAQFFRRTEPHSPVAYLADKAAHWGDMPLHVWLSTVIKDPASLSHVEELLGLRADPEIS